MSDDPERQRDAWMPERVLPHSEQELDIGRLVANSLIVAAADKGTATAGTLAMAIGDAMEGKTTFLTFHGRVVAAIVPVKQEGT